MNTRGKIVAVLTATLILGGVLGALLVGTIRGEREAKRAEGGRPGGMVHHFERVIQPESEEQREEVRGVLKKWEGKNRTLLERTHRTMRRGFDSMLVELTPILDEKQVERLKREGKRLKRPGPPRRRMERRDGQEERRGRMERRDRPEERRERMERRRERREERRGGGRGDGSGDGENGA